jgi:iron complex outermembrane receptor protein
MYSLDRWNFQAGLRYDLRYIKTLEEFNGKQAISKKYGSPNASIGAVYSNESFTFRSNISTGYRAPHPSELLANGFHHGAFRYEIGDEQLLPERATQLDVSLEVKKDHFVIVVNPFLNNIQQFIYLQPMDSMVSNLPVFAYKPLNRVLFYGGDIGLHYHPHFAHDLHMEATYSYLNVRTKTDSSISMIPPGRLMMSLRYQLNIGKKLQVKDVLVQYTFMNAQNRIAFNETASSAYQLLDASMQIKWNGKTPFEVQVGCRNIFNSTYIDHLSRLKNISMASPGRNIYISINFNINHPLTK